jgi:hypothetical protein
MSSLSRRSARPAPEPGEGEMAKKDMVGMAALMGEAVEAMAATQAMGLAVLHAEMAALAHMMPGQGAAQGPEAEARRAVEEAAVEAGFDNLPV